jgi:hypothetical protein
MNKIVAIVTQKNNYYEQGILLRADTHFSLFNSHNSMKYTTWSSLFNR